MSEKLVVPSAHAEQRKALWKANQNFFLEQFGKTKKFYNALMQYFVHGKESFHEEVRSKGLFAGRNEVRTSPYIAPIHKVKYCPVQDRITMAGFVSEVLAPVSDEGLPWLISHHLMEEMGLGGGESNIIRLVLPEHYDHRACMEAVATIGQNGRMWLTPLETMEVFLEHARMLFMSEADHSHHPVQGLFEYWAETLPYFDRNELSELEVTQQDKLDAMFGGERIARRQRILSGFDLEIWEERIVELLLLVRYFVEPRGLPDDASSALAFRNKLFELFERKAGNDYLNMLWAQTESLELPMRSASAPPFRGVFTRNGVGEAIDAIVSACRDLGLTKVEFDPSAMERVDCRRVLFRELKEAIGYSPGGSADGKSATHFAQMPIPANRYRLDLSDGMRLSSSEQGQLILTILQLVAHPDAALPPAIPDLLLCFDHEPAEHRVHPIYAHLRIRQMALLLESKYGICSPLLNCGPTIISVSESPRFEPWGVDKALRLDIRLIRGDALDGALSPWLESA